VPVISGNDIPRQVGCSDKNSRVNVRLRFPQGPALHYKEHLGALDRNLSDITLVNDDLLIKVTVASGTSSGVAGNIISHLDYRQERLDGR